MKRSNLWKWLAVLVAFALLAAGSGLLGDVGQAAADELAQEEPTPAEPAPEEPAPEEPAPEEPAPEEPAPEEPAPEEPAEQPTGNLFRVMMVLAIGGVVLVVILAIVYIIARPSGEERAAAAEAVSVPITSVAQEAKAGTVAKIVVSGDDLRVIRTDGVEMMSHKEPGTDVTQTLSNLGVTPEMLEKITIEVVGPR
jgi:pyruvate/2-oxoglutarate dehydrogenase complex dihydrolipoamide acyltransferase (E2) component